MKRILLSCVLVLGGLVAGIAGAPGPSVLLRTEIGPKDVYIGDRIAYRITVVYSNGITPAPIEVPKPFGDLEVLRMVTSAPKAAKDGRFTVTHELTLITFSTGAVTVPALPLRFTAADGTASQATTEPVKINVKSLLAEKGDEGNLRPLKGLVDFRSYAWIWITLAVIAAAALGFWLWRRRKGGFFSAAPAAPPRPPEEVAWEALHALEDSDLIEQGQVKEFYTRLSEILRTYLEGRFSESTHDLTTAELLAAFRRFNLPFDAHNAGREFLESADLVKFAKVTPEPAEIESDLNRVKQLVNRTTPEKKTEASAPENEVPSV